MEAIDFQSAQHMAQHLARYISCPSTIRARVADHFDRGVPSREAIAELRRKVEAKRTYQCGEPDHTDEADFQVRSLIPRKEAKAKLVIEPKPMLVRKDHSSTLWPKWYSPPAARYFSHRALIASVARDFDMNPDDLTGKRKGSPYVHARSVVARILKERGWSAPEIGRKIGGRDHSSVLNSIKNFDIYDKMNPLVGESYRAHKLAGWCGG